MRPSPSERWIGAAAACARVGLLASVMALVGSSGAPMLVAEGSAEPLASDLISEVAEANELSTSGLVFPSADAANSAAPCGGQSGLPRSTPKLAVISGVGPVGLRLRGGPGTQFPTHVVVREGATVKLSGEIHLDDHENEWLALHEEQFDGRPVWGSAQYLDRVDPCTPDLDEDHPPAVLANVLIAKMTAYTYQEPGNGADGVITKSGLPVAWGMVAVDPSVIPLGTYMLIEGFSQRFVARDTGFGVIGAHVDIFFPDFESAVQFGVQRREIVILADACLAYRDPATCRGSG